METVGGLNVMEEGGGGLTASHSVGEVLELGVEGGGTSPDLSRDLRLDPGRLTTSPGVISTYVKFHLSPNSHPFFQFYRR